MENNTQIFSIGHGARKIEDFINLLKKYEISYVVDVRSSPRSRFNPHFNRLILKEHLKKEQIGYLFLGDNLGGRPSDRDCYDELGRVDYNKVQKKDFYQAGILRIRTAYEKKLQVACMCSELHPGDCHRSKLIGETLQEIGIGMLHINKSGELLNQATVIKELLESKNTNDMFNLNEQVTKSRNTYTKK